MAADVKREKLAQKHLTNTNNWSLMSKEKFGFKMFQCGQLFKLRYVTEWAQKIQGRKSKRVTRKFAGKIEVAFSGHLFLGM